MMDRTSNKIVLARWLGRFGNRLFTYAFASHLAAKFGFTIYAPSAWEGTRLFQGAAKWRVVTNDSLRLKINQTIQDLDSIQYRRLAIDEYNHETGDHLRMTDVEDCSQYGASNLAFEALCCWHSWIFEKYTREELLSYLDFSDSVKASDVYRYYQSKQGTYDVAHVRRADLTYRRDNSGYSVISLESYHRAFRKFGCDRDQVVYVSDDPILRTCKFDFRNVPQDNHWSYPIGQEPIAEVSYPFFQDFLKMIFARRVFRANSSFSWWAGFLGNGTGLFTCAAGPG